MEIRFCDICNESVPVSDLSTGRAFERKGRVVCASCDLAMSATRPHGADGDLASAVGAAQSGGSTGASAGATSAVGAAASPRGEGGVATVLAAVALVGVAAVAYLTRQELDRNAAAAAERQGWVSAAAERERAMDRRETSERVQSLAEEVALLREGQAMRTAEADVRIRQLVARVDGLSAEFAALAEELPRLEQRLAAEQKAPEPAFVELESRVGQLQEDLHVLLSAFYETLPRIGAAEAPAEETSNEPPAYVAQLRGLTAEDPNERWAALETLGQLGDAAAAEHVTALLVDPDLFVRMAAARVLGKLGATSAAPALIEALEDADPSMREAVLLALRTITGRNIPFDPNGSPAERTRQVNEWRNWWKRSGGVATGP
ncbi:MAG: hypothetical protein GC161_07345 [Planctomycetaceae bacterium]|nr:hypothetical protein [Planctomycetaceae bacterium]